MCGMHLCVCFYVCIRVFFIKERVTAEEERKRDDPWLSSRGEMKKREERNRKKIEGTEEKRKVGRQR